MKYTVEVINWVWQESKPRFWFADGGSHPRIKTFGSQRAAREWLERNGFTPYFKTQKRPCLYRSPQGGMEARIIAAYNNPFGLMPKSWSKL